MDEESTVSTGKRSIGTVEIGSIGKTGEGRKGKLDEESTVSTGKRSTGIMGGGAQGNR